jgi:predicted RNA-binding Zn-ribbon protein involved in translation (DUF1610 family)
MRDRAKKIANNMLEFLIDPTKLPLKQRSYIGPNERIDNDFLDKAKADAYEAYGDEKFNSDFYPIRNRQQKPQREAVVMDRKTLIASFDILSQNFATEDPINTELSVMASVIDKMTDEEYNHRVARVVEAKASTFPCPKCGTKVLEQTGYCVKCKKKVKPTEKKASEETPVVPEVKEEEVKTASAWNKVATDAVRRTLLAEITKSADQNSPHPQLQSAPVVAPEAPAEDIPAEAPEAPVVAEKAPEAPEAVEEKAPETPVVAEKAPEVAPEVVEEKAPEAPVEEVEKEATVVDTAVLAYEGIDLTSSVMTAEDVGELTAEEKANLESIMVASEYADMSASDRAKLDGLLK